MYYVTGERSKNGPCWKKLRCWQGHVPSGSSRGEYFSSSFSVSTGHLHFLVLGLSSHLLWGAGMRHSACGKGHEEGGSTYAKVGSSLRSPPGNPRASTPITRACLPYYFVLSPTPLTLRGAVPHHLFRRRS